MSDGIIDEVTEFIRDVYHEIKAIPSDIKALINKVELFCMKIEDKLINIIERMKRNKVRNDEKNIEGHERVMTNKGNSLLTNLLLLYLCVFHTIVVIGAVLVIAWLYSPEVAHYVGELRNLVIRLDDVDAGDYLINEIERSNKESKSQVSEWYNVSDYLVSDDS